MILVVGGKYQGKRETLKEVLGVSEQEFEKMVEAEQILLDYDARIMSQMEQGMEPDVIANSRLKNPPQGITLSEVGMGVVPMEAKMRLYRDMVGKIGQLYAREAKEVYRVTCGIKTKLK